MSLKKTSISRAAAVCVAGGVLATVGSAMAQTVQRIDVTGTNIRRTDLETSAPVQTITREEISRSGVTSVRELLDRVAASTPSLSDIGGSNSFASGASSATLRNLGKTSTLILLNSRRVAPYALADFNEVFTNLDGLPFEAIDRIEILKSGASAIYGSDAVAGVINIITRRSFEGLQFGGNYEQSLQSDRFRNGSANLSFGFGNLDRDRYNVLANVEFYKRENVIWRDVLQYMHEGTFSRLPQTFAAQASTFSYPGNVVGAGPVAGCASELVINGLCRYDRYTRFEAQPSAERVNLLVSGTFQVNPNTQLYSELLFARTETTYTSALPIYGNINTAGATTWGNPQTGKGQTFIYRGLGASHPLNPLKRDDVDFRYRFVDAGGTGTPISDNYRLQFGLRGLMGTWDYDIGLGFLGSKVDDKQRGTISRSGFIATIGDPGNDLDTPLPADFFNKAGGYRIGQTNTPEVLDRLFPQFGNDAKTTQTVLDGKISTELGKLGSAPVGVALGFDVRRERFTITPTANLAAGDLVGFGLSQTDGSRTYGAAFAELSVKPVKSLELQLAARADKYPTLATNLSPKVGMRFEPAPGFVLRGTAETGFRAANLTETAPSTKFAFNNGVSDPKRCLQAQNLADDLMAQAASATPEQATLLEARADTIVSNECSAGVASIVGNNPELKPEKSKSFSLGIAVEPVRGFSFSVDLWSVKRRNEIDLRGATELLNAEGQPLPPGASITRDSLALDPTFTAAERAQYGVNVGALSAITRSFENLSRTKTSGADLAINTSHKTGMGTLTVDLQATYLHSFKRYSGVENRFGNNLAGAWTYPRVQGSMTTALTSSNWSNGVKVRHTSDTTLQGDFFDTNWSVADADSECVRRRISAGECRVAAETLFDLFVQYRGIKGLTLGAYVGNVFNKKPPPDLRELAEEGSNIVPQNRFDAIGRTLRLSLQYKF